MAYYIIKQSNLFLYWWIFTAIRKWLKPLGGDNILKSCSFRYIFSNPNKMSKPSPVPLFIFMGTSGSGKSTIAKYVHESFNCTFIDGDDLHSKDNVEKMSKGIPLTDNDRWPWLDKCHDAIFIKGKQLYSQSFQTPQERCVILACSALKRVYRRLLADVPIEKFHVVFIYLRADKEVFQQRMAQREGHFMHANMLDSQFKDLEEPIEGEEGDLYEVLVQDVTSTPDVIHQELLGKLQKYFE